MFFFNRKLTILERILILFLAVSLLSSGLYMYFGYTINRNALINGIDKRLLISAETLDQIIKPDFYENCSPEGAVPGHEITSLPETDHRRVLIEQIRVLQKSADLLYLYAVMKDEQGRYFLPFGNESGYGVIYEEPPDEIIDVLENGGPPHPQTITDPQYGAGRAVLIRRITPSGKHYLIGAEASLREIDQVKTNAFLTFLSISVGSFCVVAFLGFFIAQRISRPIHSLNDFLTELRNSEFSPQLTMPPEMLEGAENARNETLLLAAGIDRMRMELFHYLEELKTTTQSKERAESELRIAGAIQLGYLPKSLPKDFPVELAAYLKPAREAGGDLYDFIPLDEYRLFFAVGDVSGKGMPAALFMAMALTLFRSAIRSGISLMDTMIWTNNNLCVSNDSCTFITLLIGIYDTESGELTYCNGGHNPPVLRLGNGETNFLPPAPNMLLGITEQTEYKLEHLKLNPGETLVVYSDGVTEAMNREKELFGNGRLAGSVRSCSPQAGPQTILEKIEHEIAAHVGDHPQSDDITIMVFRRPE